mgnify:CR=1 FL=1
MQRDVETERGRLLRLLLLQHGAMPADPAGRSLLLRQWRLDLAEGEVCIEPKADLQSFALTCHSQRLAAIGGNQKV